MCDSLVILFSVFMNIVSKLVFEQKMTNLIFFVSSAKFIVLHDRIYFKLLIIVIFRQIRMISFGFCYYYKLVMINDHSHYYHYLIKLLWSFLVISLCWYKKYSTCLISFFSLYELFPAVFVLIILKVWLIVCLELRFLFLFLLLRLLHHLLVVAWLVNHLILLVLYQLFYWLFID